MWRVETRPDLDDLYARLSESLYVIKGRVLEFKGVARRSPKDLEERPVTGGVSGARPGGTLFTVSVTETVCRQGDFAAEPSEAAPLTSRVYFFVPRDEPQGVPSRFNPYRRIHSEYLARDREYLLFLRKAPGQEELVSTYQLDPGLTYYRTYEGDRGAVRLPDAANPEGPYTFITPLVSAVATFCDAVKAPDVEAKIRQLNAVKSHSADPAWHQSVDAAINALQQARTKAQ
jgi:hypothetical protein